MLNELDPIIGQWYAHRLKGQRFFISAIDETDGTIEAQHFDGDLEEYTVEQWRELPLDISAEPENWGGAMDIGAIDDYGTEVTDTLGADWNDPLKEL